MEAMSAGGISSLDAFFRSIVLIFNTLSELEWSSMSLSRRYSMSSSASRVSMYSLVDSRRVVSFAAKTPTQSKRPPGCAGARSRDRSGSRIRFGP